jgi:hypothetical protein
VADTNELARRWAIDQQKWPTGWTAQAAARFILAALADVDTRDAEIARLTDECRSLRDNYVPLARIEERDREIESVRAALAEASQAAHNTARTGDAVLQSSIEGLRLWDNSVKLFTHESAMHWLLLLLAKRALGES